MNIEKWLEVFHERWANHDISAVMELFTPDVEYWETPFLRLKDREELESEWQGVLKQSDIQLETEVFASEGGKHAVIWKLSYVKEGQLSERGGTYLIRLNDDGICDFFHYTGEVKK